MLCYFEKRDTYKTLIDIGVRKDIKRTHSLTSAKCFRKVATVSLVTKRDKMIKATKRAGDTNLFVELGVSPLMNRKASTLALSTPISKSFPR